MRLVYVCLLFFAGCVSVAADTPEVFTVRGAESTSDKRYQYDTAVLELALKKTELEFGPYELVETPAVTFPRAVLLARSNQYKNFFFKLSYEKKFNEMDLAFIPFPIDLGIVGYRVCFLSEGVKQQVHDAKGLNEIKRFTHGQGSGWSDVNILRRQGFTVEEFASYEGLFHMVARNRFDLFCRGANELLDEYEGHSEIEGLDYDTSMALVYPMPRFFYTHASNTEAIERVRLGLEKAYQDGSLENLWLRYYGPSLEFAQLESRTLYRLPNPNLEGLGTDYEQYFFLELPPLLEEETTAGTQ